MAWNELRLSNFQDRPTGTWWKVTLGFAVGAGLGYVLGQRSIERPPLPPPPQPTIETVRGDEAPESPRDPLLAALHASSDVRICFAQHGTRNDSAKHDAVQFALVVNTDGTVESSSVMAPGYVSLQSCLIGASGRVRFPRQHSKREVGLHTEMGSWFR